MVTLRIVFVGTGVSTGMPILGHLTQRHDSPHPCPICIDALNATSRNRRNNVSLLLQVEPNDEDDGDGPNRPTNILFDVGKTFRQAFLRTLQPRGIQVLDHIFLTHGHADAVLGLDDIRDLQSYKWQNDEVGYVCTSGKIPTYLSEKTFSTLRDIMPYITDPSTTTPITSCLSALDFIRHPEMEITTMSLNKSFSIELVPLYHGGTYVSMGYIFGTTPHRIAYFSDLHAIPDVTKAHLAANPIDILIVDCLMGPGVQHFSHYSVDDVWALVLTLKPKETFCVGMGCEMSHDGMNAWFAAKLKDSREELPNTKFVVAAYDGLEVCYK